MAPPDSEQRRARRNFIRSFDLEEDAVTPPPPTEPEASNGGFQRCRGHSGFASDIAELKRRATAVEERIVEESRIAQARDADLDRRIDAVEARQATMEGFLGPWKAALGAALGSLLTALLALAAAHGGLF
jgi:hypothetical protein